MKRLKVAGFVLSIFLTLGLLLVLTVATVRAIPLDLTLSDSPQIATFSIDVDYKKNKDSFTVDGTPLEFDDDGIGAPEIISNGTYSITATIDELGNASGGALVIDGTIASLGFNSGTLLTGNLTAFGFPDAGGDPLEFLFDVTGGDAASLFGPVVGIKLSDSGFTGSFASNFKNNGNGRNVLSYPVVTPEPGSIFLMLTGLGVLFGLRKRLRSRGNIS